MKPPCELVVEKVLPNIRAAIVKILIEDYKMKQTDISKILGISHVSISLYISSTRARDKKLSKLFPEIDSYAQELSKKIVQGKIKSRPLMLCLLCKSIRSNKNSANITNNLFDWLVVGYVLSNK